MKSNLGNISSAIFAPATILANPTTRKQKVDLYLPGPSGKVDLFIDGRREETLIYEMYLTLELEPFQPLFLELR